MQRMAQHRSRDEWIRLVDELARSGLSRAQFAEQHGLSARSLENWSYRLRREARSQTSRAVPVGFVPMRVRRAAVAARPTTADSVIEVFLGADVRVRFAPGVDCDYLGRLIASLVGAC